MSTPKLLTSREVQDRLRLGRSKTIQPLKEGKISSFWLGGRYRVREDDLNDFIERNRRSQ